MVFQIPCTAVQGFLLPEELPVGNALLVFCQGLGGALAISIGQNVLSSNLGQWLAQIPGVTVGEVTAIGTANIKQAVETALVEPIRFAYNFALLRTYFLSMTSGVALICNTGM